MTISEFTTIFRSMRFDFANEKKVQSQIEDKLKELKITFEREPRLDKYNIPDFMIDGLCVEVKIKGTAKQIYKQLVRYSEFDKVIYIVLITNRPMGMPLIINNKPATMLKMGNAWL